MKHPGGARSNCCFPLWLPRFDPTRRGCTPGGGDLKKLETTPCKVSFRSSEHADSPTLRGDSQDIIDPGRGQICEALRYEDEDM
jgi:hypothetical protein